MAFDSAIVSFTVKTNKVDLVDAAHINAVQAELVTIETILGTGVKGDRTNLKTRLNNALDPDGSILSGTSFPSVPLTSQQFYRTDLGILYIYTGSTWAPQSGNAASSGSNDAGPGMFRIEANFNASTTPNYTLAYEIIVPRAGTLTASWSQRGDGGSGTSYVKIHRNGSAVGVEKTTNTSAVYATQTDTISGWSAGDLLQFYVKENGSGVFIGNISILETSPPAYNVSGNSSPKIHYGTTTPSNGLGSIGDLFLNTTGGVSATLYVKTGSSTWTAK